MSSEKISKREFIKKTIVGGSGLLMGLSAFKAFGGTNAEGLKNVDVWKWSKEAEYYVRTPRGLKCQLCPNECTIKEGDVGDCRTRVAEEGKLYSIVYGNPCSMHVDPIEKKPLFHFYPESKSFSVATAGCNLACLNCQNWQISQKSPKETRNYEAMPPKLVELAKKNNCRSVAYTYSEPIIFYEYMYDSAVLAHQDGIKNVMISAGYIKEKPLRKVAKVIDAANIDLKSFTNDIYMRLNAGGLDPVLNTLKILKEEGVWLEITNLVVPDWTDDLGMIREMCKWLYDNGFKDSPIHFSRFHPMYKLKHLPSTPVDTLKKARQIGFDEGLHYVYIGNAPGTDGENTYCPNCKELIIGRRGFYILKNKIKQGKCENCGQPIAGVWE